MTPTLELSGAAGFATKIVAALLLVLLVTGLMVKAELSLVGERAEAGSSLAAITAE